MDAEAESLLTHWHRDEDINATQERFLVEALCREILAGTVPPSLDYQAVEFLKFYEGSDSQREQLNLREVFTVARTSLSEHAAVLAASVLALCYDDSDAIETLVAAVSTNLHPGFLEATNVLITLIVKKANETALSGLRRVLSRTSTDSETLSHLALKLLQELLISTGREPEFRYGL